MKTTNIWGHLGQELLSYTYPGIHQQELEYCILIWCKWDTTVSFHHMWDWLESSRRYVTVFTDTLSRMLLHVMQSIWQICDLASASIPDLYDTVASYFTSYCEFANDVPIADLAKQSTCCCYYVTFYDYGCCIVLKTTVHTVHKYWWTK